MARTFLKPLYCLCIALLFSQPIVADNLVLWSLNGALGSEVFQAPTFSAVNTAGMNITRGAGLNPNAGANSFNSNGWLTPGATDYVQLGFNIINGGGPWVVDTLFMGSQASSTGPGNIKIIASVDGGSFFDVFTIIQGTTNINSAININQLVTSSLVIRFTSLNNTSASGGTVSNAGTWRLNEFNSTDVILTGHLSEVPVPSGILLAGIALAVLAVGRIASRNARSVSMV